MKRLFVLLLPILFAACSQKPDETTAKSKVAELMELVKNHQFDKTNDYYSDEFNESEGLEKRTEKFQKIEATAGKILSYEFLEATPQTADERSMLLLKYKVKCTNTTLNEIFIIAMEEGKCKIVHQDITN